MAEENTPQNMANEAPPAPDQGSQPMSENNSTSEPSRGKKVLKVLMIVFLLVGGLVGFILYTVGNAQKEMHANLEAMFTQISSSGWSQDVFMGYSSPALKDWFRQNGTGPIDQWRTLGNMQSFDGVLAFEKGDTASKSTSIASFERGDAQLRLNMSKHGEKWLIDALVIEPQ